MLQSRDAKGHYQRGPMPIEVREKISKSQSARYKRAREAAVAEPTRKKCSRESCDRAGEWLRVPEDFLMRKRRLKSGEIVVYPSGHCRLCDRERRRQWKEDFIAKYGEEVWKERNKEWNSHRDRERTRKVRREHRRLEDAISGRYPNLRGPWKKYAHELNEPLPLVPAKPFVDWYLGLNGSRPTESEMGDNVARAVRRAVYGGKDSVCDVELRRLHLETVDAVGVLVGVPQLIRALYPDV